MGKKRSLVVFVALATICAATADSQAWPEHPVRLVVPFAAGGNTDVVARIAAARLGEVLGQPFIVENRAGAAGLIGAELVAHASADGYTLLMATQPQIVIAPLIGKTAYDPVKDFVPVSNVATIPFVLMVHRGLPVGNLGEFIDYVRRRCRTYGFASAEQ
jgi:tripartite-type tricarboxylate transporter receptor subunit TctC